MNRFTTVSIMLLVLGFLMNAQSTGEYAEFSFSAQNLDHGFLGGFFGDAGGETVDFRAGTPTQDHFFVRGTYDDMGTPQMMDNVVSFKSGTPQLVWIHLNDDEIYQNEDIQNLAPQDYKPGTPYNEITYNSFQFDIYMPKGLVIVRIDPETGVIYEPDQEIPQYVNPVFYIPGDRLPRTSSLSWARKSVTKYIDGIAYDVYTFTCFNDKAVGTHFSAQYPGMYEATGALKKDATLFGIYVMNKNQNSYEGRIEGDMIIGNTLLCLRETLEIFFFGTGGRDVEPRFMQFNRVALYGSKGIDYVMAESISLDKTSFESSVGSSMQLNATVLPSNTSNKSVVWSTSNSNVATVSSNGLVTCIAPGTAMITATTTDGSNLCATCLVTVVQNLVTSISLDRSSAELIEGSSMQLNATVLPSDATNKTVIWSTNNNSVATVNTNGMVTAVSPGTATITASTTDGSNLCATCAITVVSPGPVITFADANVKALCVQNWDINGDGELGWGEASVVTSLGSVFVSNSNITSFNELQYFTGLESIGNYAFSYCYGLTSVILPSNVTSIGSYAFNYCSSLNNITIPDSVTSIGSRSFEGCSKLTSINIPNRITSIGSSAFNNCIGLSSVHISDLYAWCKLSFPNIYSNPLYSAHHLFLDGVEIQELIIPDSITSILKYAFSGCSGLKSVTIPNSITSIGSNAFSDCSGLKSVIIPNSVTSIGDFAFQGCTALTTLNFNAVSCAGFSSASASPFYELNITNIHFGDNVQKIPAYFANNLSQLTKVVIPKSVTSIGKQAFNNSPAIEAVFCEAETPPSWDDMAMFTSNVYNHTPLYVPSGKERAYMSDQCWGQFNNIIGIGMNDEVLATDILLSQSQMTLLVGNSSQLVATVLPISTTNKTVTWTSSSPTVASVNDGIVTAIAPGTVTITATTADGSNLSASCVVTVTENVTNFDNYLSMNDVEAFHGDTIVIPVKMTNSESIIAFQTDIFLPEGLEIVQEDGDYLIDSSERMTRTHSIMSNEVSNGAVRVICYSSNYKPFTGNSGDDLFYITVKVADDAEGDYIIQLKNTLLTNTYFVDLAAPAVAANVNVKAYLLGDANNSGTVTITDVVVTAQYVLEMNPNPFIYDAADVNFDSFITVADVSRIAWMVLNPTQGAPRRAPALWNNDDRMSAEGITLTAGETRTVSIALDNEMDYSAFQLDLALPEGLTAGNFRLTDRAGNHAFDVNTLANGKTRALCYSPTLTAIRGNEGALLTFDVTATTAIDGVINVDGIELVTTDCQTVRLDAFAIGVNNASSINETKTGKAIAKVEYFNLAGQRMEQPATGVTLIVTTYTDGSRTTTKVFN